MKTYHIFLFLIVIFSGISSCKSAQKAQSNPTKITGDNSMNSVDWQGTYLGTLPCADCEGIKTRIVLNKDFSYTLETMYTGKDNKVFESKGNFKWNKNGSKITLENSEKQMYKVGENKLIHLDKNGNTITGELAGKYILEKDRVEITGKYWKLVRLNGKPVEAAMKEPFIRFIAEDSRVNGNSSCNMFNGKFELLEGNRIKFSPFAMTKMACVGTSIENDFMQVLEKTTSYSLTENELLLQDEYETTLAKFEADYFK